jgi:tetratricopeptide (TPR) repeat protein
LLNQALLCLQARRPEAVLEAVAHLERLWQNDASLATEYRSEALTARGLAYLQQNQPAEANTALQAVLHHTDALVPATNSSSGGKETATEETQNHSASGETSQHESSIAASTEELHSAQEVLEFEAKAANADSLNNLAIAEAAAGHADKAVLHLMAALRMEPSHSRVLNNLGVLAYYQGHYEVALKYFEIAIQIDQFVEIPDPGVINNYGVILSAGGNLDGALEQFQIAGHHERAEFESLYNLGRAFIEYGKPDKGVEFLRRAFAINPMQADVHAVLGAAYLLRGQDNLLAEALKHLKRTLQLQPQHRAALANLAINLMESGNDDTAAKILSQALKAFPHHAEILFLAALLTMDEGDKEHWAAAGGQFLHTLEVRPDLQASLYNAALCQFLMGFQDTSAKQLQAVVERDPAFAPAYFLMGVGHAMAKRMDEALSCWQKALKYEANNPDLQANMGYIYYRRQQWEQAIRCFMAAHRLVPDDPDYLSALGISFARAQMHNQAITAFLQSLNLRPHSAITHSNLGLAFYLQKQVEKAMEHWRIVSQLDRDYAAKRDEEQYRSFDDSQIALRPLNWRERVVKIAPTLPHPHTQLLPGYSIQNYRPVFSDTKIQKLAEMRRDLEQTGRRLAWLNVHVK